MGSLFSAAGKPPVGMMAMHLMTNCVIEVAGDGQNAKGVWHACGIVASTDEKTKKPSAPPAGRTPMPAYEGEISNAFTAIKK
jgi:hypothetical protein